MKLASGLAASVTVEGIEGEDQLEILQAIGCTEMQGYYFYKPLSAEEIKAVLFAGEYGRVPAQAAT
jgi:EAL domain-containing protein (putative c-di-GMP-specific phosphodiesterase class I)